MTAARRASQPGPAAHPIAAAIDHAQERREHAAFQELSADGMALLDASGVIREVNPALCTMTGFTPTELIGQGRPYPFAPGVHPDEFELSGPQRGVERVLVRRDASVLSVAVSVAAVSDVRGRPAAWAVLVRDMSEILLDARLEDVVREVSVASASGTLDSEQAVARLVASRLAELFSLQGAAVLRFDLIDKRISVVGRAGEGTAAQAQAIDEGSCPGRVALTGQRVRMDSYGGHGGTMAHMAVRYGLGLCEFGVPVTIDGRLWGCLDAVTDRRGGFSRAEERLLERFAALVSASLANVQAQAHLREQAAILRSLHDGLVVVDHAGRIVDVSPPLCEMTGFPRTELIGAEPPYPFAAPTGDDALAPTDDALPAERDLVHRDGSVVRVIASVSQFSDAQGRPARAVTVKDISASVVQVRLERGLREAAAAAADNEVHPAHLFDLIAAQLTDLLDAAAALVVRFDGSRMATVGEHMPIAVAREPLMDDTGAIARVARTGDPARRTLEAGSEAPRRRTGEVAARCTVAVPIHLHGSLWGALAVATDRPDRLPPDTERLLERFAALIAVAVARADTMATLQHQATTDGLTGLLNHRSFDDRLAEERRRALRHQRPLSLVMFDLDGFKAVNDSRGHQAGDEVLRRVAHAFVGHLRSGDVAARVGGDEFAVIAPDTDAEAATLLAERLRVAAVTALAEFDSRVTLSAGVAALRADDAAEALVRAADEALYTAKARGRNRTGSCPEQGGAPRPDG